MGNQQSAPAQGETLSPEEVARRADRRRRIAEELLQTEQTYVAGLVAVVELYILPLTEACKTSKPILPAADIKQLFSLWQSIVEFHVKVFLPEFEARVKSYTPTTTIGDVFVTKGDLLRTYVLYVNNFDQANERLQQLPKKNKAFDQFLIETSKNPRLNMLPLQGYLIIPIQRIPRYVLLLSDLLKYTDKTHPDHKLLQEALVKVQAIAKDINEMKREDENMKKMIAIQKSIEGNFEEPIVQPHRRLVRQGALTVSFAEMKPQSISQVLNDGSSSPASSFNLASWFGFGSSSNEDDMNKPVKVGWLVKQGGMIKTWKRRYFELRYHRFAYYEDEAMTKLKGVVDMDENSHVLTAEERKQRGDIDVDNIAVSVGSRVFVLKHEKGLKEENRAWERAFEKVAASAAKTIKRAEDPQRQLGVAVGKSHYVFLFNDLVVLTMPKLTNSAAYTLKAESHLGADYKVAKIGDDLFQLENNMFLLRFKCASSDDAVAWVKDLQALIDDLVREEQVRENFGKPASPSVWKSLSSFFA